MGIFTRNEKWSMKLICSGDCKEKKSFTISKRNIFVLYHGDTKIMGTLYPSTSFAVICPYCKKTIQIDKSIPEEIRERKLSRKWMWRIADNFHV